MAHGRIEHATLTFIARPTVWVGRTLVVVAFERRIVESREDVNFRTEVLEGVPLFDEGEGVTHLRKARERRVDDLIHARLLLAVANELGPEEADVAVSLVAMILETLWALLGLVVGVEGVCGGVRADEALTSLHKVKECLLAGERHRRVLVGPRGAEVTRGVEHHGIKLRQVLGRELRAILREDEFPVILLTEFTQLLLSEAGHTLLVRDDVVLEA